MTQNDLRILTINLDYNLARDESDLGDVKQRNIDYGQRVQKIFSITHTPRKTGFSHKKLSEEVEVFPTLSRHPSLFLFDAVKIARRIFLQGRVDLVLTQDPFITGLVGYILKRRYRCAYLIHFHGDFFKNPYWLKEKWYHFLLLPLARFLIKRADGIRVVSSGIKEKLIKNGVEPGKIRVIPTPVDLDKFRQIDPVKIKKIINENQRRKTILNVARNDKSKDFATFFRAIEQVYEKFRNLCVVQIGAGFFLPEKIKTDNNLLLISKPRVDYDEVVNYYYGSDLYVSASCHESFGKVVVEAMACGLPVVATETTGSKDIIEDGKTGFLVPVGDSSALAKKILWLLNNPSEAEKMGRAGKEMVRARFNREKLINEIIAFWQELAGKAANRFSFDRKELAKKNDKLKNLLIITRRLDKDDGQTGFFYLWVNEFSRHLNKIKVICLEKGNIFGLAENVEVYSLGKEQGKNRWREFVRFQLGMFKFIFKIDGIFCHMGQIYTILAGPYAKIFRKKLITWYSHRAITWQTKLMHFFSERVITPTPEGFGLRSKKKVILGHGIDTERFKPDFSRKDNIFRIVSVARFSPIKDYETLIEAVDILKRSSENCGRNKIQIDLVFREPETKKEKDYFIKIQELIKQKNLTEYFNFLGTIPNEKLPDCFHRASASINLCPTGSPDKVVYEAMACGLPTLACNETFIDDFGPYKNKLLFQQKNSHDLAEKLSALIKTDRIELETMGMNLRQRVVEHHNLTQLIRKIIEQFSLE